MPATAVTPRVGVWIETQEILHKIFGCLVTPRVGVWIETSPTDPSAAR